MRVLMICPELPNAGNPGSMAPAARQIESLRQLGLSIDVVDMRGIPKLKYLQVIPKIRRLARHADVIHAHFGYCGWLGFLAPAFSRRRAPLVVSFMGDDLLGTPCNTKGDLEWFSRLMVRANKVLATKVDQVIVKSQEMAEVIAPAASTVIPNGIDVTTFRPMDRAAARRQLNLPSERNLVLFPGNPDNPRKGHQLAVAAVAVASRELNQPIDLVPLWSIEPDQVAVYMNACDAMVMTSMIEGSPNVVKEAMACNVPIVGVLVGDVQQLLDGVPGCELCTRDPEIIGRAMVRALAALEFGGREAIIGRGLDLQTVARRIVHVYERALDTSPGQYSSEFLEFTLPPGESAACPTSDPPATACDPPAVREGNTYSRL